MTTTVRIRPARPDDLDALHAINEAAVPKVGGVTRDALLRLMAQAEATLAAEQNGRPVGFVLALGPGQDYASLNYQWFEARQAETGRGFLYVDRIAVREDARGLGLGAALYEALFAFGGGAAPVCCEVNTAPPNPGSMRFHGRLGFVEVGRGVYEPGVKEVAFLERPADS